MSKFKGTPGPWRVARQNGSPTTGEWMIAGAKPGYLAEVRDCGGGFAAANARLIAAAPKLLDAAIMAIEHYDEFFKGAEPPEDLPWVPVMREAIKEALGEDRP